MEQKDSLGNQIKTARQKLGFTQAALAEKCNLNIRTIQRIERDEVIPRMYTLQIMSNILGVDLTQDTDKKIIDEEVENYRRIYRKRNRNRSNGY